MPQIYVETRYENLCRIKMDTLLELSAHHIDFGEVNYAPNVRSKTAQLHVVNHSTLPSTVSLMFEAPKQSNDVISIELINFKEVSYILIEPGESISLDFQLNCVDSFISEHARTSYYKVSNRCCLELILSNEIDIHTARNNVKLDFSYSAILCTSIMYIENLVLDFQDLVLHETYLQEFTIWNRSESYLKCRMHFEGDIVENILQLVDMENMQEILCGSTITIPSFAPKRVGVKLFAEVCQ